MAAALTEKFTMASPFQHSVVWSWNEEKFPCVCCSPLQAVEYGTWTCVNSDRTWCVVDGVLWADEADAIIAAARAAETAEQRAKREQAEQAQEEDLVLTGESSKMASYAAMQKIVNTSGKGKAAHLYKVTGPCKWLYCDEKAPKSQWRKNENGEWCAPVLKAMTGSQCWAWEYTDPKKFAAEFKRLKGLGQSDVAATAAAKRFAHTIKHSCKFLHPGEDGWLAQWEADRGYKPPMAAPAGVEQRWFALKGGAGLAQAMPQQQKAWQAQKPQSVKPVMNSAW